MKTSDVLAAMEKLVAPLTLSEQFCKKYGAYDNSGIILDSGEQVKGILFCLDLTPAAVKKAKSLGCNLIFTHHPAIFGGIKSVICQPQSPTAALGECMRAGMSVISMHLNFDAAPQGIDYYLMRALGGEKELALLNPLEGGGYGRIYNVQPQTFAEFSARAVSQLSTQRAPLLRFGAKGGKGGILLRSWLRRGEHCLCHRWRSGYVCIFGYETSPHCNAFKCRAEHCGTYPLFG